MTREQKLEKVLIDLLTTIDLHTDCMDGSIDSKALINDIDAAENLLAEELEAA